ncbi:MAG TPA: hypothetical protein VN770_05315 [Gaiellaceae bacterium]|nr:hypothetical protein [Gaiellaceae bacterium]
MLRFASLLRSPFSFLFTKPSAEEHVVAYVLREHGSGRRLEEILQDPFVQNRLSPEQQQRMLARPDVIHVLGEQDVEAARAALSGR